MDARLGPSNQNQIDIQLAPQPGPQTMFCATKADVCFYGGGAGGGKTAGLLIDFLRHYGQPVACILFRRTTPMITKPGAVWDTSKELYQHLGTPVEHTHEWKFPGRFKVKMDHLEHEDDKYSHQGAQYGVIAFDELTHFTRSQFFYLMGRNRSMAGIKPYIRATLNPDPDHFAKSEFIDWYLDKNGFADPKKSGVLRYFIADDETVIWGNSRKELAEKYPHQAKFIRSFTFIPANLSDNKILTSKDPNYEATLNALPRVERERLAGGNWNIRPKAGMYFPRDRAKIVDAAPVGGRLIRYWDRAGTEKKQNVESHDPDYTVGALLKRTDKGEIFVLDVVRFRATPLEVETRICNVASQDGTTVDIWLEQEPGSSGIADVQNLIRKLAGYKAKAHRVSGDKVTRAGALSAQWEAGNVACVRGEWNKDFLSELESFPQGSHDDQVDAVCGAFNMTIQATTPMLTVLGQEDETSEDKYQLDYGDND